MIKIKIESVGFVDVLQLASRVDGTATVLVDLGDGFRDRFVTWSLARRDISTCKACGRRIERVHGERGWYTTSCQPCAADDLHVPTSNRHTHEYHAYNGHYHGQRMNAERDFEERAGYRTRESI